VGELERSGPGQDSVDKEQLEVTKSKQIHQSFLSLSFLAESGNAQLFYLAPLCLLLGSVRKRQNRSLVFNLVFTPSIELSYFPH
jgi:hypothetical protein